MNDEVSEVLYLVIDRGYTMANEKTKHFEYKCMERFISKAKKVHLKILYGLVSFNQFTNKICDPTTNLIQFARKYESIKNNHEMIMTENYGSFRSKYRKCYDAIRFCANELVANLHKYSEATFRILVLTDGIIDQSDEITVSKIANHLILNKIYLDFCIINGWISPIVEKMAKWSGGSVFQISNQSDIENIFGNPAFHDLRIRRFKKRKIYKITYEMVMKNDIKRCKNFEKTMDSVYGNHNIKNELDIQIDSNLNDILKKIKEIEEDVINISKGIQEKIDVAPDATVIFLVGNTGNGKSTFMNCMDGKCMESLKIGNRIVLNIENMPLNEINPLGHDGKSKTRTIEFLYVPKLKIIFVDCPGYFDSAGPDRNLINSIAINQVFNGNRSLKMKVLAFVSNEDFGQRSEGVIDALNMVYGLIPNEEILKKCLGIVITKCRKIDQKINLKKLESMTKTKSEIINSTWNVTEYIKNAYENHHIWNFPLPDQTFHNGLFNNFSDSQKIIEFMSHDPVIDPPHSIPLDLHSYEMILSLIHIIGNCYSLINNLFDKISQEYLLNRMNICALKCWRCQMKRISKIKFKSLGELASHIETILPFPETYSDIFKSMNLLTIFQKFTGDVDDEKKEKNDIFNSLNRHKKDFFNEEEIVAKMNSNLVTLNNCIQEAENDEKEIMNRRNEANQIEIQLIQERLNYLERIQISKDKEESLRISIDEEERRFEQRKREIEEYKKKMKRDYETKRAKIIKEMQKNQSDWIKDAEAKIDELHRKLKREESQNQYLSAMVSSV